MPGFPVRREQLLDKKSGAMGSEKEIAHFGSFDSAQDKRDDK
jgi:hypothetical protein